MLHTENTSANPLEHISSADVSSADVSSNDQICVYRAGLEDKDELQGEVNKGGITTDTAGSTPVQVNTTYALTAPALVEPFTEFTVFPKLPLELRKMIFQAALPPPSVVHVATFEYTLSKPGTWHIQFIPHLSTGIGPRFSASHLLVKRGINVRGVNTEAKGVYEKALPFCLPMYFKHRTETDSVLRFGPEDLLFIEYPRYTWCSYVMSKALSTQAWTSKITKVAFEKSTYDCYEDDESNRQKKSSATGWGFPEVFQVLPNLKDIKLMLNGGRPCQGYEGFDQVPEGIEIEGSRGLAEEVTLLNEFVSRIKRNDYVVKNKLNVPRFSFA